MNVRITVALVLLALPGAAAPAAIRTWTGGAGNNSWTSSANWGGTAPVAGDALVFSGTTRLTPSNNFAAGTSFAGITFNSTSGIFTLYGNSVALTAEVANNSTNLQTLNLGFSSSSTCSVNTASGDITANGVISGSCVLYKRGAGKLTLGGNNTYSVGTTIAEGTLSISRDNTSTHQLGALDANCKLTFSGGALEVTGGALFGSGQNWLLRNVVLGPGGGTVVSAVELGHEDYGSSYGLDSYIAGGTADNGLTLKGWDIVIRPGAQNTLGKLTVYSGRAFLRNDAGNRYPVGPGDQIVVNDGATLAFNDHMPRSITNSMTFASGANLSTRWHTDYSGVMTLSTDNAHFPAEGTMIFNSDDASTTNITINGAYPTLTGALVIQVGGVSTNVGTVTLNGPLSGGHALMKTASGRLVLNATNTHAGGTTVGAGTLEVKKDGGFGSGNVTVASGAWLMLNSGATHDYIHNSAQLLLSGSPVVNLNYSGTDTIAALSFDGGSTFETSGTWGSTSSSATHKDSRFTGNGILRVAPSTLTEVSSSQSPSVYGQGVVFTATVSVVSPGAGTPVGTVQFKTNGGDFGSAVALSGGAATSAAWPVTTPAGTWTVTAVYIPSGDFGSSTGALAGGQAVNPLPVSLTGSRTYDGTATADAGILTVSNKVGSDDVAVASGSCALAGALAGWQTITSLGTLALGGTAAGNYTLAGGGGAVTILAGPAAQTCIETAADGGGTVLGTRSIRSGESVTVYAVTRDAGGNFVANANATWSLVQTSGGIVADDLVPAGDGKSAVFTGHAMGTAKMQADAAGFTGQSGALAVPLEAGIIHLPPFENASIAVAQPAYPGQAYWVNGTNNDRYAQWSIGAGDGVGGSDAAVAHPGPYAIGNDGSAIQALRVYYFPVISNTQYTVSFFYKAIGDGFASPPGSNASEMQFLVLESPNLEGGSWLPWAGTNITTGAAEWRNGLYTFTSQPATRCVCLKFGMMFGYGNRTDPADRFYLDDDWGTTNLATSSANPSVYGQPVTFSVTVSPAKPDAGTPAGSVQFKTNGGNFGSAVTLAGGSATSETLPSAVLPGNYAVTVEYGGGGNFTRSAGALAGGQSINKAGSRVTAGSSQNPSVDGEWITFSATVSAVSPGAGTPAGTVQFKADGEDVGSAVSLASGSTTSAAWSSLAIGTHEISAEYGGDAGFMAGTGMVVGGHTVNGRPALGVDEGCLTAGAGSNVIEWVGTSSWHYTVQSSPSLFPCADWSNLPGYVGVPGLDGMMSATDTNGGTQRLFYRIMMTRW